MALAATIVETLFSQVDDNLSIPLFSGLTAQILGILIN
jgi:dolichol kinase